MRGLRGYSAAPLLNCRLQALELGGNPLRFGADSHRLLHSLYAVLKRSSALILSFEALVLPLKRIELPALFFKRLHASGFLCARFRIKPRFLGY